MPSVAPNAPRYRARMALKRPEINKKCRLGSLISSQPRRPITQPFRLRETAPLIRDRYARHLVGGNGF